MTSITGAEVDAVTFRSQRLSVLPIALGATAIGVVVIGARLADLASAGPAAPILVWATVAGIALTVTFGHPAGLYGGLASFLVATLLLGPDPGPAVVVAVATIGVAHELVRFSLDARMPARIGRRVWWSQAATLAGIVVTSIAVVVATAAIRGVALPALALPVGLGAAALPLYARRLIAGQPDRPRDPTGSSRWRWAIGLAVAGLAIGGSIVGAEARSGLGPTGGSPGPATETTTTAPPVPVGPAFGGDGGAVERLVSLGLLLLTMLVVGAVVAALRRPERTFDLDELQMESEETTLGLAGPGSADTDDVPVEIDEQAVAELLDSLVLDISAEPDPGRAIRYGYATIERRLSEASIERGPSETERELLLRALGRLGASAPALAELTRLFEHARFGHLPVTEEMRAAALAAIGELQERLVGDG